MRQQQTQKQTKTTKRLNIMSTIDKQLTRVMGVTIKPKSSTDLTSFADRLRQSVEVKRQKFATEISDMRLGPNDVNASDAVILRYQCEIKSILVVIAYLDQMAKIKKKKEDIPDMLFWEQPTQQNEENEEN